MEHLGFLLKEKSYGNLSLRGCPAQFPAQNRSLLSLIELQTEKVLKNLKSLRISFHQKEPTWHLACGGV